MSYHTPEVSGKKVLGGAGARSATVRAPMSSTPTTLSTGNKKSGSSGSAKKSSSGLPSLTEYVNSGILKPTISTEELGLVTDAERNRKGYLSTYLEGQAKSNKISNFLKG